MTGRTGPVVVERAAVTSPIFPLLDGLRGIAALGVFCYHLDHLRPLPAPLHQLASHGNAGVPLFFLLSGFLLYRPLLVKRVLGKPISLRQFYLRRAARILPAYWVALTLLAIWPGAERFSDRWWQLYLLGQDFDPGTTFAGIGPAWSLAIEATFYLLLPLYALLLGRRLGLVGELVLLGVLAVLAVGFHVWIGSTDLSLLGYTLPGTFYLFAVGMGVAVLDVRADALRVARRWIRYPAVLWGAGALLYVVLSMKVPSAALGSVHPVYAIVALLVFLPAVLGSRVADAVLGWRPIAGLGLVSYAFYLWHQVVIEQWVRITSLPTWLLIVVSMATVLTISVISYRVVELPVLRAIRRPARA
jgi:peptidoglycan/LPS O-acetylase OafA/YrhL